MYSANYLLRTGDVRWAIDPLRMEHRLAGAPAVDTVRDLGGLSFVVLTHRHSDHLDMPLIRSLSHLPIDWVVPAPLCKQVTSQGRIPAARIIAPEPLQPIDLHGIRITPFRGMHWEAMSDSQGNGRRGVPALGYLAEFGGKRWLFPGDTRTYDRSLLPSLGPVDGLFAHVWLGRGCALQAQPALLEPFCRFFLDLQPRRIVLTHLREFARAPEEYWDQQHASSICARLRELDPEVPAEFALMGQCISL